MAVPTYILALTPPVGNAVTNERWNGTLGSGASITYSFMASTPGYYATYGQGDGTGFQKFTLAQITAAEKVLDLYEEVCNLEFTRIKPPTGQYSNSGEMVFANNSQGSAGYAYLPSQQAGFGLHPLSGDVWMNKFPLADNPNKTLLQPGEAGFQVLLHEIGHALGMEHPFDDGNHAGPYLTGPQSSSKYTVMSYTGHPNGRFRYVTETAPGEYLYEYPFIEASTPMLYDIATMQYLYGANMSTRAGNNIYTFENDEPFLMCIWDAGGKDTISVSNFTEGCNINLNAGKFSSITILPDSLPDGVFGGTEPTYDGTDNLSIAFGARIENATGGAGKDSLTGNQFANALKGNGGNDTLNGGSGKDNLNGGTGKDRLIGGGGNDTLTWQASDTKVDGGAGTDTLKVTKGNFDLTSISDARIVNMEIINLTGGQASELTLTKADVLAINGADTLKVLGTAGVDGVTLTQFWTDGGEITPGFITYTRGAATLLVQNGVDVALID